MNKDINISNKERKPLGRKSYGHILHFKGSRVTPTDKHCSLRQQKIMTIEAIDDKDLIIVQEKLDGTNCSVVKLNDKILALGRAGYLAETSPYIQHLYFAKWVEKNEKRFYELLKEGERVVGEWLMQAHGTRYNLKHEAFVPFDIMVKNNKMVYNKFIKRVLPFGFTVPRLIHTGKPYAIDKAILSIEKSGHGAIDEVEGVIYRCEREEKVGFLCKWVRPDRIDGKFLPEISGGKLVWNVLPSDILK